MGEGTFQRHEVPGQYLAKWQKTVDLAAELFGVNAALIRRADGNQSVVLVSSNSAGNPYKPSQRDDLGSGCYCDTVMLGRVPLTVGNAGQDLAWQGRLAANKGMLSYYGVPLVWPDRSMFGTLCVADRNSREFSPALQQLLARFKELIEGDFRIIHYLRALDRRKEELEELVMERTAELREANAQLERELAERKRMEEVLLQSKKMESIGRLAGGVAHDFNNMLGVILGCTQLSMQKAEEGSALRGNLTAIAKAAERSREITRQLLAFSRKEIIAPRAVNLNAQTVEAQKIIARLIGEDIKMSFSPADDLWIVNIDPSQFDQILMNLAANARDAMPDGGSLSITTANITIAGDYPHFHPDARAGEYVQITIADDGQGMPREVREHAFEPFFTTKGVGQGTGLGLATVYGIVTQNNGFINVYSEPGQGTVFRIYLPRLLGEVAVDEEQPAFETHSGSGTILLVEDDELLLWITSEILQEMGYIVIQAPTPQTALDIFEKGEIPIDLVLTDVVMPDMNGKELVDRIKAMGAKAKIMFMSGYTADIVAQRGILEEGMSFIQKPINPGELNDKIKRLLAEH